MAVTGFWIEMIENSYSISDNTSNVTVNVKISTNSYTYNFNNPSGTITWGGLWSGATGFSGSFGRNATTTLYSWTGTVNHNADGSGWVSASASFATGVSAGTVYASKTLTLTTIPRASTPSVSGTTQLGEPITINTNRVSSAFTHTTKWSWAGESGTIATGVGASTIWVPDIETFAPYLPNETSSPCTITCDTYNGSTLIGTKTASFTLSIPPSVVPSISSIVVSDVNNYFGIYGAYVKSKSKVKVITTASGVYSSTIKTYQISMDGLTGSSDASILGVPPTSGTRTITAKVTDSRGRTVTETTTITVCDYSEPSILSASALRWSGDSEDDESTTVRVAFAGTFFNINSANKNGKTISVKYKPVESDVWTTKSVTNSSYTPNSYVDITGLNTNVAYDVQVVFTDNFTSTVKNLMVSTAKPIMDFKAGGKGMAIGKVATKDALDIRLDTFFDGSVDFSGSVNFDADATFNSDIVDKFGKVIGNGLVTGSSLSIDPNMTTDHIILTNHETNRPADDSEYWYIITFFYSGKSITGNRAQIAVPYHVLTSMYYRFCYNGEWSAWRRLRHADEPTVLMVSGTVVLQSGADHVMVHSLTQIADMFTSKYGAGNVKPFTYDNLGVIYYNGDDQNVATHFYNAEYWPNGANYWAYYYPAVHGSIRVNYTYLLCQ